MRLTSATHCLTGSRATALALGLACALSPQQVAWSRFLLTEALFLALACWIVAELLLSLRAARLRIVPLAVAISFATFVRYDGILFAVPVAVVAFAVHEPVVALRRGTALAILTALPLLAWAARTSLVGLSLMPPSVQTTDGAPSPVGYMQWRRTWEVTSYQAAGAQYAVNTSMYGGIDIDPVAYRRAKGVEADRATVEGLVADLRSIEGQPFPPAIDAAFAALAEQRRAEAPFAYWVELPARRTLHMWFDPLASGGWPAEARSIAVAPTEGRRGFGYLLATALANPQVAIIKGFVSGYRMALLVALASLVVLAMRRLGRTATIVVWMAAGIAAARTAFFVFYLATQARYLVAAVPFLEAALVIAAFDLWRRRRQAVSR